MAEQDQPRFILEFPTAEALLLYTRQQQGSSAPEPVRKVLVNELPQTFKVRATEGTTPDGQPAIILSVVSRGEEDTEQSISLAPGDRSVI